MSSSAALPVSLEFFPPKTPEGVDKLRAARQRLYALKPEFCSVTYGAGGSTQEGTFNTVRDILAEGVAAASHFSCIGATQASVREQLAQLKAMGVQRLVALRGDLPSGYGAGGEFHYASDRCRQILGLQTIAGRRATTPAGDGLAAIGAAIDGSTAALDGGQADAVGRRAGAAAQSLMVAHHGDDAIGIDTDAADIFAGLVLTNLGQTG